MGGRGAAADGQSRRLRSHIFNPKHITEEAKRKLSSPRPVTLTQMLLSPPLESECPLILRIKIYLFYLNKCFVCMYACLPCVYLVPTEGTGSFETEVMGNWEPPCGPLGEWPVLLLLSCVSSLRWVLGDFTQSRLFWNFSDDSYPKPFISFFLPPLLSPPLFCLSVSLPHLSVSLSQSKCLTVQLCLGQNSLQSRLDLNSQ